MIKNLSIKDTVSIEIYILLDLGGRVYFSLCESYENLKQVMKNKYTKFIMALLLLACYAIAYEIIKEEKLINHILQF